MRKIFLIISILLFSVMVSAQSSRFQRNFTKTDGTALTGFSNYIFLVPQADTYPTGALALTEDGTRPGVYYRINVADGEYKIYIDADKGGANPPTVFIENYWVGEQRLSVIANHFDAGDSYRLFSDGIKDGAVTNSKLGTNSVTESKIANNAVTADKINDASVTTNKIFDLSVQTAKIDWGAVTSGKILDANVTLPKLSQTVIDYINASGGGTINNFPDDVTLETKPGSTIGVKDDWWNPKQADLDSLLNKSNHVFTPQMFGAVADSSTNDAPAIQAALQLLFDNGGGELYLPAGNYIINDLITIPRETTASGDNPYKSRPLKITGAGSFVSGRNVDNVPIGGTVLVLNYAGSEGYKIFAEGNSSLEISGITFYAPGADSNAFILTTNTALQIHNCSFWGARVGTSANQDAILLGGTYSGNPARSDSSGFQGYGTVITENYFNKIRRAVYGRTFANNIVVTNNNIWNSCGSNLGLGAAIEFEGNMNAPVPNALAGEIISGNLIEIGNYPVGIKLYYTSQSTITGNSFFDPSATVQYYYYLDEGSQYNYIIVGHHSDAYDCFYEYETTSNTIINPHQSQYSYMRNNFRYDGLVKFKTNSVNNPYWIDPSDDGRYFFAYPGFSSQPNFSISFYDGSLHSMFNFRMASSTVNYLDFNNDIYITAGSKIRIQEGGGSELWLGSSNAWYIFGTNLTGAGYLQLSNISAPSYTSGGSRFYSESGYPKVISGNNVDVFIYNQNGSDTFASSGTKSVSFARTESDTNYRIVVTGNVNETFWVTSKTTSGFTLNSSNASSTATVDWVLVR